MKMHLGGLNCEIYRDAAVVNKQQRHFLFV